MSRDPVEDSRQNDCGVNDWHEDEYEQDEPEEEAVKHSPTPWTYTNADHRFGSVFNRDEVFEVGASVDGNKHGIAVIPGNEANAAHIVQCVNAHEADQLKIEKLIHALERFVFVYEPHCACSGGICSLCEANAAIAFAKGEQ